jgi:flavin reductase (DIM6/NTAB) family NADH-FMN oxidoreductase RutF
VSFDKREFRNALGGFATGVAVVTTRAIEGHAIGITINSFSSVSLEPPLVLWSLVTTSPSLAHFVVDQPHVIHVLARDQEELAKRFASPMPDKFAGVPHDFTVSNVPRFDGCVAVFECRTRALYEEGDHVIIVARVEHLIHREREPLLFCSGKFAALETAPPPAEPKVAAMSAG